MLSIPVITGLGLVTPLGRCADETWRELLAGRFITNHFRAGGGPERGHDLAIQAAGQALAETKWTHAALVVGTSKGAVDAWMTAPPAESFLGSVAVAVRERFPLLDGPSLTISAACASGLHALIRGAMMIMGGETDRVLVVAAEASVHPLFIGSFQRLGVLPKEGVGCRPFDVDREGFLMSEAAAAVCLEWAESGGHAPYARIDRFALGGDAIHMTGNDPAGATLRRLLRRVANARPVELIHAHGTGTVLNDPVELAAFDDECCAGDAAPPPVYSHKGALGHSLGASGLVSVVLNCLMHRHGVVPPNVQTRTPLATTRVRIARDAIVTPIHRSLAVAAGFGGPAAAISLISA